MSMLQKKPILAVITLSACVAVVLAVSIVRRQDKSSAATPSTSAEKAADGQSSDESLLPNIPAKPAAPTKFVDVASSAGLNYRWHALGKEPRTILESIGNGCAFLDYNNDGNLDVL